MTEGPQQQVRSALEQMEAAAPPHDLPTSAQVWSRLQFRLAYRPRRDGSTWQPSTLLVALYVLALLLWTTRTGWLSVSLLAVLACAAVAAAYIALRVSRSFRS